MYLQEETAKTNSTNECFILEKWFPKGLLLNEGRKSSSTNEKEREVHSLWDLIRSTRKTNREKYYVKNSK
jgi:hypothetical protein